MKIRPIFKTIDIFSFIQFLSRQTNYIIKFFLLKVLYLVWKPLESAVDISTQNLTAPVRTGFTAVEWGGCQVR